MLASTMLTCAVSSWCQAGSVRDALAISPCSLDHHQVVAVDDLLVRDAPQHLGDLLRAQAQDPLGVGGGIVGQAAGELVAGRVAQGDHVALAERAVHLRRRRWAAGSCPVRLTARLWRRRPRAIFPLGRAVKPSQRFQAGNVLPCGRNSVPTGSPAKIASRIAGVGAVGHDDRFARRRRQPGRPQLAPHAAGAERALAARRPCP